MDAEPSRKSTVPVGVPALPDTVAVKVTLWPELEGFVDEASETTGFARDDDPTLNAYDAMAPTRGTLCGPALTVGASCASVANAWRVWGPEARPLKLAVYGPPP